MITIKDEEALDRLCQLCMLNQALLNEIIDEFRMITLVGSGQKWIVKFYVVDNGFVVDDEHIDDILTYCICAQSDDTSFYHEIIYTNEDLKYPHFPEFPEIAVYKKRETKE
jgi:hypothetical protein